MRPSAAINRKTCAWSSDCVTPVFGFTLVVFASPTWIKLVNLFAQRDDLREVHVAIEFEKLFKSLAASLFDLEAKLIGLRFVSARSPHCHLRSQRFQEPGMFTFGAVLPAPLKDRHATREVRFGPRSR
jgi:hypothetical protein